MTATSGGGSVLLLTASACWPPDPVIITAAASLIMIWDAIQPTPRCSPRSNDVSREPQTFGQSHGDRRGKPEGWRRQDDDRCIVGRGVVAARPTCLDR